MTQRRAMVMLGMVMVTGLMAMTGCQQGGNGTGFGAMGSGGDVVYVAPRDRAIGILELAASSQSAELRANALEAMNAAPDLLAHYVREALADENRAVRFVAAMSVGTHRMEDLSPLVEPLLLDSSESVRAAAIFALRQCGRQVDVNPLASMIRSDQPEVRANAALVLGKLGNPSAAPMIEQTLGDEMFMATAAQARLVELQLTEALIKLGRRSQIHTVRAALFLPTELQEVTALACQVIAEVGDRGSIGALQRLIQAEGVERRAAEVRMAAAMALARLGEPVPAGIAAEFAGNQRPQLRAQAAMTLAWMEGAEVEPLLGSLLEDDNPLVQLAAAGGILRRSARNIARNR